MTFYLWIDPRRPLSLSDVFKKYYQFVQPAKQSQGHHRKALVRSPCLQLDLALMYEIQRKTPEIISFLAEVYLSCLSEARANNPNGFRSLRRFSALSSALAGRSAELWTSLLGSWVVPAPSGREEVFPW